MKPGCTLKTNTLKSSFLAIAASVFLLACLTAPDRQPLRYAATLAGTNLEFGEPFGIAVRGGDVFISDGQNGCIWRVTSGTPVVFASGFTTPSGIAFDKTGNLIVADSGSHSIKSINEKGIVSTIAGIDGRPGFADDAAATALFLCSDRCRNPR